MLAVAVLLVLAALGLQDLEGVHVGYFEVGFYLFDTRVVEATVALG